jgi:hypothetical protein
MEGGGGGARNIAEHLFTAKKKINIYKFRGAKLFIYMDYMRNNCLKYEIRGFAYRARIRKLLRISGIDSARLCSLAGRYDK